MIRFFIERPKFSIVLSLLIILIGGVALKVMPVALHPNVAPPSVNVFTSFRGANAQVVTETVASIIEKQVNGVEGMIYMRSNSSNSGQYSLDVYFETGFDGDRAATLVQNRVNAAMPMLPEEVKREGVTVEKMNPSMLMMTTIYSPDESRSDVFLSNYADKNLKESLSRLQGVSKVELLGEKQYAMRIWIKPEKMQTLGLTATDILNAVREQNATRSAGNLGAEPIAGDSQWQYTVTVRGRLVKPADFENIRLKSLPDGTIVRLSDVASVELGAVQYEADAFVDNKPAIAIAIYQDPNANAMEMGQAVRDSFEQTKRNFPSGVDYGIPYDSTENIAVSIDAGFETLLIALFLVTLVTYFFLGSIRATVIVTSAIPPSLIGTFAVFNALGISVNTISLFGIILAIGIVVDAAIIVIENVERLMHDEHLDAKPATIKAMQQVLAPLIASAAVLVAVFAPTLAMPGMVGIIYSQFGTAIVISVILSTIVAMTLTPALTAMLMKHETKPSLLLRFDRVLARFTHRFTGIVQFLIRKFAMTLVLFGALIGATAYLQQTTATGLFPEEDAGVVFATVDLPSGAALNRTRAAVHELTEKLQGDSSIESVLTVPGYNLLDSSTNSSSALIIIKLHHWNNRQDADTQLAPTVERIQAAIDSLTDGLGFAFGLPAVPQLGFVDGFEFVLTDNMGRKPQVLDNVLQEVLDQANQHPSIAAAFSTFRVDMPNMHLNIDEDRAAVRGVEFGNLVNTINTQFGGSYANDFTYEGRNYKVMVQAESDSRANEDDLNRLHVRNSQGQMLPVSQFVSTEVRFSPANRLSYNVNNAALINGVITPGYSSGGAIAAMEAIGDALPEGFSYAWSGLTLQEKEAGNATTVAFIMAMVVVYLLLVAQFESWLTPFMILIPVPTAALGTFSLVAWHSGEVSLYTQIALVLMIGMAARNSILIVEFAKILREKQSYSILDAALTAVQLRMRAILMTALAFAIGMVPLMIASSAGAGAQQAIGYASFGGIVAATFVGCLLVPPAFVVLQSIREKFSRKPKASSTLAMEL